ncbi:MAG TPA: DUF309 domain-containing protein [Blastocatellia bacterium]
MTANPTEAINGSEYDATHQHSYPREYLEGIAQFNAGRYYDAHETWEAIWLRSAGDTRLFYHMLIQAAVALYHHERGNAHGARTLYERACKKLQKLPAQLMSLDVREVEQQFKTFFAASSEKEVEAAPAGDKPRPLIRLNVEVETEANR